MFSARLWRVMYPAKGSRVKVRRGVLRSSAIGRTVVTVAISAVFLLATGVANAHAITRPEVLKRANHWIRKHVQYSQSAYYQGYRRDCSGFVSMAWKLKTSYTSSTISSRAHRISMARLKPGDAVRRPGHVEIFDGWKSKKKRQYWALEESQSGLPALRRVKTFKSGYSALRLKGIKEVVPVKRVAPAPVIPPPPLPSNPPTSTESSASPLTVGSMAVLLRIG